MNSIKDKLSSGTEVFWLNPDASQGEINTKYSRYDIENAEARLIRFAPYISEVFPETKDNQGLIESNIIYVDKLASSMNLKSKLLLKLDSHLPISGSVKARGGIYEVLKFAEKIAIQHGILSYDDDYSKFKNQEFKTLFSKYSVAVGSTGNLGLSIGIISAKLGFKVTVHMSSDAQKWKKDLLRQHGALVIEYPDDYEKAVTEGRKAALKDPNCHFVDDENSIDLFMGYSVAGKRLKEQFDNMNIIVDENHPLYVYIPCGVGGAPGGITFGIKEYFGEHAHVYFAEPTMAPCMTLGLITKLYDKISVKDIGLSGQTIADGLAVGRCSKFVGKLMTTLLDGSFTVDDCRLYPLVSKLFHLENVFIEPSACAGFVGVPAIDFNAPIGSTHLVWATGGNMVPDTEKIKYLK